MLGQGSGKNRMHGLKACKWQKIMYMGRTVWSMAKKERNAQITSMNTCYDNQKFMQNQSQNIPMRTLNIKFVVTQSLRLRVCFHIQMKPAFQQLFFYQVHTKHPSPFWHSGKSFITFTLQVHISFKNTFCCILVRTFRRKWVIVSFFKSMLVLEKV